jgi:DNA-binding HxlR family transcriptional regulator
VTNLSLDTICNAFNYHSWQEKWTPAVKTGTTRDVGIAIISLLFGASKGALYHARARCSQAEIGKRCGISREWANDRLGILQANGWVRIHAPRRSNGTQEVSLYTIGRQLKRLLKMLLKSGQRRQPETQLQPDLQLQPKTQLQPETQKRPKTHRVNTALQKSPISLETEESKQTNRQIDRQSVDGLVSFLTGNVDMLKKIGW